MYWNQNVSLLVKLLIIFFKNRDRDKKVGQLNCRICKTAYAAKINHLSAEVDVFCDWIDQCHKINNADGNDQEGDEDEEEDDDMIEAHYWKNDLAYL